MTMAYRLITDLDEGWDFMQMGIIKVRGILEGVTDKSINGDLYMYLYTTIYNLCTKKHPHDNQDKLYDRYKASFDEYINLMVLPALRQKHGEFMLRELVRRWENHKVMVRWLSRFFDYLDRYYVPRRSLPTLRETGLMTFCDLVYNELKTNARNAVIALIEREREGEQIDQALLKNALGFFVEIGMGHIDCYLNDFEAPMLEDTGAYYSRKAALWIIEDSCPDYLLKAEECLQLEKDRVSHYLHASSEQNLLDKVQNELLAHYENQILEKENSGVRALLRNDKQDDLSRMFKLFHKVTKGLDPIANNFKQHVIAEGSALVKQAEDAATNNEGRRHTSGIRDQVFVRKVIELHDKYTHYVVESFQNHNIFQKTLKEAFETFCNNVVSGSSTAEMLSTFSDNVLKKGSSEKLSDDEIDLTLEKVVKILAYLYDKDLFTEFYRKKLARRLLFDRSANNSNEQSMLTKLKQQRGSQFTAKMEGMVTDLSLARDNQNKFEVYLNREDIHVGLDLSVTVLTTGFWPTYKSADITLPIELVKCIDVFKQFYSMETKYRKLTWMYSLGTCIVEGRFDVKTIELVVATYQTALLMLFNESEKLKFADIKSLLNFGDDDVNRVLHSLACAKYKILLKESDTQKIVPTDYFEFNSKFTDKSRRIKIPLPQADEKKKIIEDVDKDRRYAIDASLVRIMKSRKVLSHQQLLSQCVEQLGQTFKPDIKAIKRRIEDLITREYLERDAENHNLFKYLA